MINDEIVANPVFFSPTPPEGWEQAIHYPMQSPSMAEAFRTMGYIPYYTREGHRTALVQIRDPIGRGGSLLARASVYPANENKMFLEKIIEELRKRGVGFVRIGNTMWGSPCRESLSCDGAKIIERFTFRLDLSLSDQELLRSTCGREREIRKAKDSGIQLEVCKTEAQLEAYASTVHETQMRIRNHGGSAAFLPFSFYRELFRQGLYARGTEILFIFARHEDRIVAGTVFLIAGDTMLYYQGASVRIPTLGPLHASAACLWAGVQRAKARGLRFFDLGGHTPNLPVSDSRSGVYNYKKKWGGTEVKFYNAEIIISPLRYYLQETAGKVLWNAMHPMYFKLRYWMGSHNS